MGSRPSEHAWTPIRLHGNVTSPWLSGQQPSITARSFSFPFSCNSRQDRVNDFTNVDIVAAHFIAAHNGAADGKLNLRALWRRAGACDAIAATR